MKVSYELKLLLWIQPTSNPFEFEYVFFFNVEYALAVFIVAVSLVMLLVREAPPNLPIRRGLILDHVEIREVEDHVEVPAVEDHVEDPDPEAEGHVEVPEVENHPIILNLENATEIFYRDNMIGEGGFGTFYKKIISYAHPRNLKARVFGMPIRRGSLIKDDGPIILNLKTLKKATQNFDTANKIGQGGFGAVYKGILRDGKEIAVKHLSCHSRQGKKEFLTEYGVQNILKHKNLVNILGCCQEQSECLIVYECLPNNSLDKLLFDSFPCNQLDWEKRFNIISGIACGLVYLHDQGVIHRDIKASNILLDQRMNAKIGDFGLAKLIGEDESHVSTRIAGTIGYMAPEYALTGYLSLKADIYSFGVLLLEIVCGRKNTDLRAECQYLIELVWRSYERGEVVEVIDRNIVEKSSQEQALRCIHVGLLCIQPDASLRPNASTLYSMLSNSAMTELPRPAMPAYASIANDRMLSHTSSQRNASVCSVLSNSAMTRLPRTITPASVNVGNDGMLSTTSSQSGCLPSSRIGRSILYHRRHRSNSPFTSGFHTCKDFVLCLVSDG